MRFKYIIFTAIILFSSSAINFAQRPPQPPRMPQGERPPRGENERPPRPEWFGIIDVNQNGKIEIQEYETAAEIFFRKTDENGNGILEKSELRREPGEFRPKPEDIPPFLFLERGASDLSRGNFAENIRQKFANLDTNGDGVIDRQELDKIRPPRVASRIKPPNPPNPQCRRRISDAAATADRRISRCGNAFRRQIGQERAFFGGNYP